jgi:hypothetical protein
LEYDFVSLLNGGLSTSGEYPPFKIFKIYDARWWLWLFLALLRGFLNKIAAIEGTGRQPSVTTAYG